MGKLNDLTGQRFGKLIVIDRAPNRPNDHHVYWLCKCDCGKEVIYQGSTLTRGKAKSCGCIKKKDLTGQIFGRLTVISHAYNKDGRQYWNCQCSCGNLTIVSTHSLTSGNTQSCGCYRKEQIINSNIKNKSKVNQDQIIGKYFDFLEVLAPAPPQNGYTYYLCKCHNCGNIKEIRYSDLVKGRIHACGCLQSFGEQQLKTLLTNYNILFKTQYKFDDLYSAQKYPLRFDFGIINKNSELICLIEYQGEQHYNKNHPWYSNMAEERDNLKYNYCKKHNIPLYYCDKTTDLDQFVREVILPMATMGVCL